MKKIKLTQGQYALVDDEDYPLLIKNKWFAALGKDKKTFYAARTINGKNIGMHRIILGVENKNVYVDHINHDSLDNRRSNLRTCSYSQNCMNRKLSKNNSSGYKGVDFDNLRNKYRSRIGVNLKQLHIGFFETAIEAAKAYNAKALELHGEFAFLNKV